MTGCYVPCCDRPGLQNNNAPTGFSLVVNWYQKPLKTVEKFQVSSLQVALHFPWHGKITFPGISSEVYELKISSHTSFAG
jgi:hypothetical protein